jgi:hypothetical protein
MGLLGAVCNIPGLEATNKRNIDVCIASMHVKSGETLKRCGET